MTQWALCAIFESDSGRPGGQAESPLTKDFYRKQFNSLIVVILLTERRTETMHRKFSSSSRNSSGTDKVVSCISTSTQR